MKRFDDAIGPRHPNTHIVEYTKIEDLPRHLNRRYHGRGGDIGFQPDSKDSNGTLDNPTGVTFQRARKNP